MPKQEIKEIKTYEAALRFDKLLDLMLQYDINPRDKDAWMHLCMKLSEHLMPDPKTLKTSGAPTKWNIDNNLRLYALIETLKADFPDEQIKEIYYKAAEKYKDTMLDDVVKSGVSSATLSSQYKRYRNSDVFKSLKNNVLDKYSETEKLEFFRFILNNHF